MLVCRPNKKKLAEEDVTYVKGELYIAKSDRYRYDPTVFLVAEIEERNIGLRFINLQKGSAWCVGNDHPLPTKEHDRWLNVTNDYCLQKRV